MRPSGPARTRLVQEEDEVTSGESREAGRGLHVALEADHLSVERQHGIHMGNDRANRNLGYGDTSVMARPSLLPGIRAARVGQGQPPEALDPEPGVG